MPDNDDLTHVPPEALQAAIELIHGSQRQNAAYGTQCERNWSRRVWLAAVRQAASYRVPAPSDVPLYQSGVQAMLPFG